MKDIKNKIIKELKNGLLVVIIAVILHSINIIYFMYKTGKL